MEEMLDDRLSARQKQRGKFIMFLDRIRTVKSNKSVPINIFLSNIYFKNEQIFFG